MASQRVKNFSPAVKQWIEIGMILIYKDTATFLCPVEGVNGIEKVVVGMIARELGDELEKLGYKVRW